MKILAGFAARLAARRLFGLTEPADGAPACRPWEPEGSHPPPQHRFYPGAAMIERYKELSAGAHLEGCGTRLVFLRS
jgi:hypothetical protein